jgi:hypothetical protein
MGVSEYGTYFCTAESTPRHINIDFAYLDGAGSEVLSVVEVEIGYFLEI